MRSKHISEFLLSSPPLVCILFLTMSAWHFISSLNDVSFLLFHVISGHLWGAPEIARKHGSREVSEGSSGLSALEREGVFSWSGVSGAQHRVSPSLAPYLAHRVKLAHFTHCFPTFFTRIHVWGKRIVYGPGWRFHDVSHWRGSPLDGKCLQGKVQLMNKVFEIRTMVCFQLSDKQFNSTVTQTFCFIGQDSFRVLDDLFRERPSSSVF